MNPPLDPGGEPISHPFHPDGAKPKRVRGKAPKCQGLVHSFRAFRHRDYTIFWFGALASNTGTWLSNLTGPYILFTLTGSAVWVAYATAAQLVPSVLLGPLGGHVADRFNRRRVLLATQTAFTGVLLATQGLVRRGDATRRWTLPAGSRTCRTRPSARCACGAAAKPCGLSSNTRAGILAAGPSGHWPPTPPPSIKH